jgi:hypothetical protein
VVRDAGAGELRQAPLRERRGGGVDDQARRELGAGRVVVADDHLEAGRLQRRDFGEVADAAVDGQEQVGGGRVFGHPVGVDAVAVADAVGDERFDLPAERAQPEREERGAGDAVGVVVAVDPHAAARLQGVDQAVGGRRQVGDGGGRQRRVEVVEGVVAQAARPEDGGELRVDAQGGRQPRHRARGRRRAHAPHGHRRRGGRANARRTGLTWHTGGARRTGRTRRRGARGRRAGRHR